MGAMPGAAAARLASPIWTELWGVVLMSWIPGVGVARRRRLASALVLVALAGSEFALASTPARANPAGTGLVISEVYGGGGVAGAPYNADFVELFNPTSQAISLNGLALHYRTATNAYVAPAFALSGSIPAHRHYLVRMSGIRSAGAPLPTPNAIATPRIGLASRGGQVLLLTGAFQLTASGDLTGNPRVVDMVGLGSGAKSFEGAPTANPSVMLSANRQAQGQDTDRNKADFTLAPPSPTPTESDTAVLVLASVTPATIPVVAGTATLTIQVVGNGPVPTGSVAVRQDGSLLGEPALDGQGRASLPLGAFSTTGARTLTVHYPGDGDNAEADATPVRLVVTKAAAQIAVSRSPGAVKARRTRPTVTVTVTSAIAVTGRVRIDVGRRHWLVTLVAGKAQKTLPAFDRAGRRTVRIRYLGSAQVATASTTLRIKVGQH